MTATNATTPIPNIARRPFRGFDPINPDADPRGCDTPAIKPTIALATHLAAAWIGVRVLVSRPRREWSGAWIVTTRTRAGEVGWICMTFGRGEEGRCY